MSRADAGPDPDALQLAFHEFECASYDERFGIRHDAATAAATAREVATLAGGHLSGRILDVGSGTGYLAIALAREPGTEVHALDLSPGMLARAAGNAADAAVRVHLCRGSAAALPYPDGAFAAVVSRGVLHHLHDPVAALAEWRRVTRAGGPVVIVSEPSPRADRVGGLVARATLAVLRTVRAFGERVGRPLSRHAPEDADERRFWDLVAMAANLHTFTPDELADLGRASGFRDVRVEGAGLTAIAWATAYYVLVGELPALAASARAKQRASRTWRALRRVDRVAARLVPDRALLTVRGVFAG